MSARVQASWGAPSQQRSRTLAQALGAEARALLAALAAPQALVGEVQAMGELLAEAQRVEAHDPARAEALRQEASRRCV